MRRLSTFAGLVLTAGLLAAPALAATSGQSPARASATERPVLVCATDAGTRRAFTREHGAAPQFITARQALTLRPTDAGWATPRCMTAQEHARYKDAMTSYARAR